MLFSAFPLDVIRTINYLILIIVSYFKNYFNLIGHTAYAHIADSIKKTRAKADDQVVVKTAA